MACSRTSTCGWGKRCGASSRHSMVHFHGPLPDHSSMLGVASCGGPYLPITVSAASRGVGGQRRMIASTASRVSGSLAMSPPCCSDRRVVQVGGATLRHLELQALGVGVRLAEQEACGCLGVGPPGLLHGRLTGYQVVGQVQGQVVQLFLVAAGGQLPPGALYPDAAVEGRQQACLLGGDAVVDPP